MGSVADSANSATAISSAAHPGDSHEVPAYEAPTSFTSLKDRIKQHYDIASTYYYSLWGQHIHHGYFLDPSETNEQAQVNLINFMLDKSELPKSSKVLDVGCGVGGTSRFLAEHRGCTVTGITISSEQVKLARQITAVDNKLDKSTTNGEHILVTDVFTPHGSGKVHFIELDAEKMLNYFTTVSDTNRSEHFDCVWITEALSHIPNKQNFFSSSFALLKPHSRSKLVIADWFKAPDLTPEQVENDIKAIEDGMLLPRLYTMTEYVDLATEAGFKLAEGPLDISKDVAKTWDISWSLVSSPSLWAFAISQGRDGLAFLQAFRAMRRGYANGSFRYGVMCFEKP